MASTTGKLLRFVRRRPLSSAAAASTSGAVAYAFFVENQSNRNEKLFWQSQDDNNQALTTPVPTLPRVYDWDALNNYWYIRPVTSVGRLFEIVGELLPLMARYIWDFKIVHDESNDTVRDHAQAWRHALTDLGPAFVKAGQQISIRPDLVPPIVLEELQKLCDSVRPVSDEIAMGVLKGELGAAPDELFDDLRLVASASLGQVYKGKIKGTDEIVEVEFDDETNTMHPSYMPPPPARQQPH